MKSCRAAAGVLLTSLLVPATIGFGQTPTISLHAVKINDVAIAASDSITVNPGDIIEAEVFVSEWSPNGETSVAFQASIARASFVSGTQGSIAPVGWDRTLLDEDDIACPNGVGDCPSEWPVCMALPDGGNCVGPDYEPALGLFMEDTRSDWALSPCNVGADPCLALAVIDMSGTLIRFAATLFFRSDGKVYAPPAKYAATMKLIVSGDALGTFTFDVEPFPLSQLLAGDLLFETMDVFGLTIEVVEPPTQPLSIPTLSAWGGCILMLSLFAAARVYFGRSGMKKQVR